MRLINTIPEEHLFNMLHGSDALSEFSCNHLSIFTAAVRRCSEGGEVIPLKTIQGEDMPQFLIAIQHPNEYQLPAGAEGEAMMCEIGALNREMIAAGVRDFAGGLQPAAKARTVRKQASGEVLVSDGPFLEAKEYVGGIWLLRCADMDEALVWAKKAAVACRVPVEVREFLEIPAKWKSGFEHGMTAAADVTE